MTNFNDISLAGLAAASETELDDLPFGVIAFDGDHIVVRYNRTESQYAGLSRDRVIGQHLFDEVAMCMNNFMVAQRFADEPALDTVIDYVLTLRMRPTKVKLRLLKSPEQAARFLLISRQ